MNQCAINQIKTGNMFFIIFLKLSNILERKVTHRDLNFIKLTKTYFSIFIIMDNPQIENAIKFF